MRFKANTIASAVLFCLAAALSALWPAAPARCSQPKEAPEYQLKAAFLYNILQFTQWPEKAFKDADSPVVICVADEKALGTSFAAYQNDRIQGRKLVVKPYVQGQAMPDCQVLFLNTQDKALLKEALGAAKSKTVLTVGESDGFAGMGGIVNFFTEGSKLRFEINADAAKRAGLKLSSEILKVAKIVTE